VVDQEAADEKNAAPIVISLENHCGAHGQRRLAEIMREVFGHRLLSAAVREKGTLEQEGASSQHVTLAELGNKIVVIVEYHLPNEESSSDSSSSSEDEEEKQAHQAYRERRRAANATAGAIIPELAELGIYAQSVKPVNDSW
jgi:phosphatidylinositol phospholipase C delta